MLLQKICHVPSADYCSKFSKSALFNKFIFAALFISTERHMESAAPRFIFIQDINVCQNCYANPPGKILNNARSTKRCAR